MIIPTAGAGSASNPLSPRRPYIPPRTHRAASVEIAEETLFVDEGRQLSAQAANTAARPHTSAVGVGRAVPPPAGALSGAAELQPAPLPGTLAARALATAAGPEWARGAADVRTTGRQ